VAVRLPPLARDKRASWLLPLKGAHLGTPDRAERVEIHIPNKGRSFTLLEMRNVELQLIHVAFLS
jgi:hypothetical protein